MKDKRNPHHKMMMEAAEDMTRTVECEVAGGEWVACTPTWHPAVRYRFRDDPGSVSPPPVTRTYQSRTEIPKPLSKLPKGRQFVYRPDMAARRGYVWATTDSRDAVEWVNLGVAYSDAKSAQQRGKAWLETEQVVE